MAEIDVVLKATVTICILVFSAKILVKSSLGEKSLQSWVN